MKKNPAAGKKLQSDHSKKIDNLIKNNWKGLSPKQKRRIGKAIEEFGKRENIKENELLEFFQSSDGIDSLKMAKRNFIDSPGIIQCLQMKFNHEFEKLLGNFLVDEKIKIIEGFIKIAELKLSRENAHREKINEEYLSLQKEFRERFQNNLGLIYFDADALQYKCVGNDKWDYYQIEEWNSLPGAQAQLLSEAEFKLFLEWTLRYLKSERSFLLGQPGDVHLSRSTGSNTKSNILGEPEFKTKNSAHNLPQFHESKAGAFSDQLAGTKTEQSEPPLTKATQSANNAGWLGKEVIEIKRLLVEKSTTPPHTESDHIMTIGGAAELLHKKVETIRKYVRERKIPFSRKGKSLYFFRHQLMDWVSEGEQLTKNQGQAKMEKASIKILNKLSN